MPPCEEPKQEGSAISARSRGPRKALVLLLALSALVLTPFYLRSFAGVVLRTSFADPAQLVFWPVFLTSTLFFLVALRKRSFFAVFEHELTHVLWCLLCLGHPRRLVVGEGVGRVVCSRRNMFITLAPYFCPTLNFLVMPFYYLLNHQFDVFYFGVFAALLGYHTSSTIKGLHLGQSDLKKHGLLLSSIVILFANILAYGTVIAFAIGRGQLLAAYLASGVLNMMDWLRMSLVLICSPRSL